MFRKCLAEEIRNGVLVTGDYTVTEMPGQQVGTERDLTFRFKKDLTP